MDNMNSYIIFQISTNKAIINVKNIQEIIVRPEEITPILNTHSYVEGLVNLRGEAIPVIDLRTFLNVEKYNEAGVTSDQTILIIKKENKRLGIIVDAIYHVEEIDDIEEEGENETRNTLYNEFFPKVIRLNDELVSIFDAELIFEETNL